MENRQTSCLHQGERGSDVPLESWKEIAAYRQPEVRTHHPLREKERADPSPFTSDNELDSATDVWVMKD